MTKNLVSGPILAPLAQIWDQKVFFLDFVSIRRLTLFALIVCNFMEN